MTHSTSLDIEQTGNDMIARALTHMPQVVTQDRTLRNLKDWWQKVALTGKINSHGIAATLLEDMEITKHRFDKLRKQLIDNLVIENLHKQEQELGSRAQVAIDILIRNLFERTADVGFLATDDDLRAFLMCEIRSEEIHDAMQRRLSEYTQKYSVYDEIVVLDVNGHVQINLDNFNNPITRCSDPLIEATLTSGEPYVETFGHSDLQPKCPHSLIYSARITESDEPHAPVLGVLCLCFRFDDEMVGIFANLRKDRELLAILDKQGTVIASSDQSRLAYGMRMHKRDANGVDLSSFAGECHLSRTAKTKGYQGFFGLDWQGHVTIPVDSAFGGQKGQSDSDTSLTQTSNLFSDELRSIAHTAATVTDDLILVVLNGQIVAAKKNAKDFMPVLDEIRTIGRKTKSVFDTSIADLYGTVLSSLLSDLQFQAYLAVDIMDRNLYERANDVRWWAMTTRFRQIMGKQQRSAEDLATLHAVLNRINALYTVYTNLFLYDTEGRIVAVSNPEEAHRVGTQLPMDGSFKRALGISESSRYTVSSFSSTPLYADRPTYIYLTSIRATNGNRVVGGIGIVFDAEPQFEAMLVDVAPRDANGTVRAGSFGVFADRQQRVIASTREDLKPGDRIKLDSSLFQLDNGQRRSLITEYAGQRCAVGAAVSQGYREYKTSGDYDNDVVSLICVPI